jgi:hypothetical protein
MTDTQEKKRRYKRRHPYRNGHPQFTPTPAQRHIVAKLIALRVSWDEIRQLIINPNTGLPITKTTLARNFKRELAEGGIQLKHLVASKYFEALEEGRDWAIRLGMRNRFGWINEGAVPLPPPTDAPDAPENNVIQIEFVVPTRRKEEPPPIDATPQDPPDYTRPALEPPRTMRVETPFGEWRIDDKPSGIFERPQKDGWMK